MATGYGCISLYPAIKTMCQTVIPLVKKRASFAIYNFESLVGYREKNVQSVLDFVLLVT